MTRNYLEAAVAGDENDRRDVRLLGGGVDTLDDVIGVDGRVWAPGAAVVTLTAVVQDSARKIIRVNLGSAGGWLPTLSITDETEFFVEYDCTFNDGRKLTWPNGEPDRLVVRPQGS